MKTGLLAVLAALALVTTGFSGGWHGGGGWTAMDGGGGWHGGGGWRGGGFRGGYYGRGTTAVAGTGMLATIDGTAVGAGGAAVTTRGGYFRFHGLTRITVITDQVTGMGMAQDTDTGMDRVTATDTESGSVILRPLFSGRIG